MSPRLTTPMGLLALASAVAAYPYQTGGYGDAPFGMGNSTGPFGTGSGFATGTGLGVSTGQMTSTLTSTLTKVQTITDTVHGSSETGAVAADNGEGSSAGASGQCGGTVTVTETNKVTVTFTPSSEAPLASPSSSSADVESEGEGEAASSTIPLVVASSSATIDVADFGENTGYSPSFEGGYSFPGYTAPSTPESSAAPVESSSSSSAVVESAPAPTSEAEAESTPAYTPAPETTTSSEEAESTPVYTPTPESSTKEASPTAEESSAAPSSTAGYSSGNGKRGLAYNDVALTGAFDGSSEISWAYNWASSGPGLSSNFEFVPMLWGLRDEFTSAWEDAANSALESGSSCLLAFNEPDHEEQANLAPSAAADGYRQYMSPFAGAAQLGTPAVTNGADGMGLDWLASFMDACSDCPIDFAVIHWYDAASNTEYFKNHVTEAHELTGLPVWVTEFGASGSEAEQAQFLEEVMAWMDGQDFVERYSYFMVSEGNLVSGDALTEVGDIFSSYVAK